MRPHFMLLAALVALAASIAAAAGARQKVVLYGDDDYAPYSYVENGQFKGIYVDLLRLAGKRLARDYDLVLQPVPWKRGLGALESGSALGLFPPYKIDGRDYIGAYSYPLYRETVVLFCSQALMNRPRPRFPDDFRHLRIGVNLGFALTNQLVSAQQAGLVLLEEAKGNQANLRKLALGRVDCYANDRVSVLYSVKQLQNSPGFLPWHGFKPQEAAQLQGQNAYIGYSRAYQASYKGDFIERMNGALQALGRAGTVDKIVAGYTRAE